MLVSMRLGLGDKTPAKGGSGIQERGVRDEVKAKSAVSGDDPPPWNHVAITDLPHLEPFPVALVIVDIHALRRRASDAGPGQQDVSIAWRLDNSPAVCLTEVHSTPTKVGVANLDMWIVAKRCKFVVRSQHMWGPILFTRV